MDCKKAEWLMKNEMKNECRTKSHSSFVNRPIDSGNEISLLLLSCKNKITQNQNVEWNGMGNEWNDKMDNWWWMRK